MVTEVPSRDEGMFKMVWEYMCLVCSGWETREREHDGMGRFDECAIRKFDGQGVQRFFFVDARRIKCEEVPCWPGFQDG
jgi:hypothetical protein